MRALPVAERELRVAARRPGTYWMRFGAAGVAMGVTAMLMAAMSREPPRDQSQGLFVGLSILGLVYCLLSGVLATADSVSEEKRDGTLGLLFLTNLRGYDIVLGKVVANSATAIAALIALLPLFWIPLMMGGVGSDTVMAVALCLGNTMFLSLAIGMLVSVLAPDARRAVGGTVLVLIVLTLGLPVLRWILLDHLAPPGAVAMPGPSGGRPLEWLLFATPALPMELALESMWGRGISSRIWQSLAAQHLLGWISLGTSCLVIGRVWRDRASRPARVRTSRAAEWRTQARSEWLERAPFGWVVAREQRLTALAGFGLLFACGIVWILIENGNEPGVFAVVAVTSLICAGGWLKLHMALVACRHLHEQRRSGALELVLTTPLGAEGVLRGTLRGLRSFALPPAIAILAVVGVLLLLEPVGMGHEREEFLALVLVGAGILLLDLWTIAWAGARFGLHSRRLVRAVAMVVGLVMLLPWALYIFSLIALSLLMYITDARGIVGPDFRDLLAWWVILAVVVDVLLLARAQNLRRELRELGGGPAPGTAAPASGGRGIQPAVAQGGTPSGETGLAVAEVGRMQSGPASAPVSEQ